MPKRTIKASCLPESGRYNKPPVGREARLAHLRLRLHDLVEWAKYKHGAFPTQFPTFQPQPIPHSLDITAMRIAISFGRRLLSAHSSPYLRWLEARSN